MLRYMSVSVNNVSAGNWIVDTCAWKRYGDQPMKVIKVTPHTITLGLNGMSYKEMDEEDTNEDTFEVNPVRFKLHHTGAGDYICISKSKEMDCMGYDIWLNKVYVFNTLQEIYDLKERISYRYREIGNIFDKEYGLFKTRKELKERRNETVRCLVKKTVLPVELKYMITQWM